MATNADAGGEGRIDRSGGRRDDAERGTDVGRSGSSDGVRPDVGSALVDDGDRSLSREEIFEVLSNRRRQHVIEYLHAREDADEVRLCRLVDAVAARENGKPVDELTSMERKRVYAALRQSHLPKLDDAGVIEYDSRRNEFVPTDELERVRRHLEYVPESGLSWSGHYLALSGLALGVALLVSFGVPPFDLLAWSTVTWLVVAAFGLSSVVYAYRSRPFDRSG